MSCDSLILFSIPKYFLDPGFVPADSKKAMAPETVVSGVQGTITLRVVYIAKEI